MSLPIVAIVGRPNVGKSSLFNWLAGRRISIVDPTAGVTRDRVSTAVEYDGRHFELVDTGGMGIQDVDNLTADVERQIQVAVDSAAVVLFLTDARAGTAPLDEMVAARLRGVGKPVVFVANKVDDPKFEAAAADLARLGYGSPILVSAEQKKGHDELMAAVFAHLPATGEEAAPRAADLKIALVGRRNVGKSTFINSLAKSERVIVSEIPGTTRDSVDVRFERDGKAFLAIDTAGVRKKKSLASDVEFYSLHRAERSIRRADVVMHLFDPRLRISRVDKQLAEYILEHNKPAVFVVNKWDAVRHLIPTGKWADYLRDIFPMLDHVPIAFTSAKHGKNVYRLLNLSQQLHKQDGRRIKTGDLNRAVRRALDMNTPPVRNNRVPKVYYAAQIAAHPPTIALVTNGPDLFDDTYVRYLTKAVRDASPFGEVAIKLVMKAKGETGAPARRVDAEERAASLMDDTDEVPVLAAEPSADDLAPRSLGDPGPRRPAAPARKPDADPPTDRPRKPKKKKPESGTWEL